MVPVLQKMPADHWICRDLLQWIKENETSEEVLRWSNTHLSSADHEALSKLYEPPPPQEPEPIAPPIDPIAAAQLAWEDGQDTDAFANHFRKWIEADAVSAQRWVEDQGDPKLMDTWRSMQVAALMKSPNGDPKEDYKLSLEISDPRRRESSVRTVIERWMRDDPIKALEILKKAPLGDRARTYLQKQAESQAALVIAIRTALPH